MNQTLVSLSFIFLFTNKFFPPKPTCKIKKFSSLSFFKKSFQFLFFYFSPFYLFIFPTPIFNSNLKSLFQTNSQNLSTPTNISKQEQHPVLFKIPFFKTNHKTSYPNNTFQNKNIKTTHFLSIISLFFFFHFFSTLLKRLCITTKNINSKIYYLMYSWLFSQIHYRYSI